MTRDNLGQPMQLDGHTCGSYLIGMLRRCLPAIVVASLLGAISARGDAPRFEPQELAEKVTVGYAVSLIDMNADKKTDILVVDSKRVIWFENPSWKVHTIMSAPDKADNVCVAPLDIDGDSKLDIALGADWTLNTKTGGTIQWFSRPEKDGEMWPLHAIGEEPTVHRIRWIDLYDDGKPELVVLPLMGRDTTRPNFAERGVRMLAYSIPKSPKTEPWPVEVLCDDVHVSHNFVQTDLDGDSKTDVLVVSFEGVSLLQRMVDGPDVSRSPDRDTKSTWKRTLIGEGNQKTSPNRGASEIKHAKLADGRDYIATIEPWHGNQIVVYTRPEGSKAESATKTWTRHVLDEQLQWGHAVWCANLDDDKDEELIIGVRDDKDNAARRGVRIFDPVVEDGKAIDPTTWKRTLLDSGNVAVEDLAAGDLDGDGRNDIVAVGRATHNVKIYWNRGK
jgi:hypothetical protein